MRELTGADLVVDVAIALLIAELVGLALYRRFTGRGIAMRSLAPTVLAGMFILIALRLVLAHAPLMWAGLCLALALAAHGVDLAGRWRR